MARREGTQANNDSLLPGWMPLSGERLGRAVDRTHLRWQFERETTRDISGQVISRAIGPLHLSWVKLGLPAGRWRGSRGATEIQANPEPYLTVMMPLEGTMTLRCGEQCIQINQNELVLWDSTQPLTFDIRAPRYEQISLLLPQRVLRAERDACHALHCYRVDDSNILSDLCLKHMATLAEFLDEQLRPYEISLTHVSTSLIDAVIASLYKAPRDRDILMADIKRYIECYIDDDKLTPNTIAKAFEISTRYLHKLFRTEDTTVSKWVLLRRLERSAEDLIASDAPVTDIAFKWGFKALGHYSRTFKTRFGESPSAYRLQRLSARR
ncbi:MAG: helix-turn-helix domain-containing protein [Gammaproteobacteria bacterium]